MITKGERTELRSIVRQQFKVLRHEVVQRQAEMIADLDAQIATRYAETDKARSDLLFKANEICEAASREITDLFRGSGAVKGDQYRADMMDDLPEVSIERPVRVVHETVAWCKGDRTQLRRAAIARIEASVKGALLSLERREADLLRTLAIGAIESDEARSFLTAIPTVGELVTGGAPRRVGSGAGQRHRMTPSTTTRCSAPSVGCVALVASWELLAADDVGESELEGRRIVRVSAIATTVYGELRAVQATVHLTPRDLDAWCAEVDGRRITP